MSDCLICVWYSCVLSMYEPKILENLKFPSASTMER